MATVVKPAERDQDVLSSKVPVESTVDTGFGEMDLSEKKGLDSNAELSDYHIFQDGALVDYWTKIYDEAEYEGRHRFDPDFQWTKREERDLVRRLDIRVMLLVWVLFFGLDLIRYNLSRALASAAEHKGQGDILTDLGINQNDVNHGWLAYYVSFLSMELPSGLMSKRLGPERWVPIQIFSWSIVCACQAAMHNKTGFFITRVFLGLVQGGFIPDMCLYLTYFYTSAEMNVRMSWFYTVLGASQIIGSFLSIGFMKLNGVNGVSGWRYLFGLDSCISALIGLSAVLFMPATITNTTTIAIRKPWLNEREEKILVNRLLRDDPTKGDMNNHQAVSWRGVYNCLRDFDAMVVYLLAFVVLIPYQPPTTYLSLILSNLGFDTLHSNLLTIPSMVLFMFNSIWMAVLSTKYKEKSLFTAITNFWVLPCIIALVCIPDSHDTQYWRWVRYGLFSLIDGLPYPLAFMVGWISENSYSVQTRTISLCLLNIVVQAGSIATTFVYTQEDQPYYHKGNTAMAVIAGFSILQCFLTRYYFVRRNKSKARKWDAMTPQQQVDYTVNSTDFGPHRLDVRLAK